MKSTKVLGSRVRRSKRVAKVRSKTSRCSPVVHDIGDVSGNGDEYDDLLYNSFCTPIFDSVKRPDEFQNYYDSLNRDLLKVNSLSLSDFECAQMSLNLNIVKHATQHVDLNRHLSEISVQASSIKESLDASIQEIARDLVLVSDAQESTVRKLFDSNKSLMADVQKVTNELKNLSNDFYNFQVNATAKMNEYGNNQTCTSSSGKTTDVDIEVGRTMEDIGHMQASQDSK